jgi:3-deoxy-D-manno-octulosonic-acid transferase
LRFLYTILFYLALPFIFLRLLWRARLITDNRKRWLERLGFCPFQLKECIWVHAVSVGETIAAVPLIKKLKEEYLNIPVVITTMTVTGAARVQALFGDEILHALIPYDLPGAVARFLKRIRPKIVIIMETELWPNLFAACKRQTIPIVIINARLSEKSMRGYQRVPTLTRNMLSAVKGIAAQGDADAKRFISLGMFADNVMVTGNIKFDLEMSANISTQSTILREQLGDKRFIWIAASTHPTEEEIILKAHRLIQINYPNALLILVPRHPDRFNAVANLCKQQQFNVARRSQKDICSLQTEVYLSDTMGELLLMYSVADVAFVGGSFVDIGGHNMLEPAALHKPIITGTFLYNFADIKDMLLIANGMRIVNNAEELAQLLQRFFSDSALCQQMGENAYHVIETNRGALAKQLELIKITLK